MRFTVTTFLLIFLILSQAGCTVVTATVGVASVVVGGAIEVVDTVTPDIFDDDDDDDVKDNKINN